MKGIRVRVAITLVLAVAIVFTAVAPALAIVRIYVSGKYATSLGVGYARLSRTESYNISKLGSPSYRARDTSYEGQVVYKCGWGTKIPSGKTNAGHYRLEMFSKLKDGKRITFAFWCYTSMYYTTKNIHVGSTESALRSAYGSALRKGTTGTYTPYTLNSAYKWRTTFYCRNGKVQKILISMPL